MSEQQQSSVSERQTGLADEATALIGRLIYIAHQVNATETVESLTKLDQTFRRYRTPE